MVSNKALMYKKIPTEWPEIGEHLTIEERSFDDSAAPPSGGATTRNLYVSYDPYMRGKMRDESTESYSAAYRVGAPLSARTIAQVLKSDSDKYKPGDVVITSDIHPIEEYSTCGPEHLKTWQKLDASGKVDLKYYLGPLGMPGLTAYSSFYEIGEPKEGETIFISAASGAVGQLVGQLAKREKLRVIGSVGDDAKLDFIVNELKFDGGFNYKKEKPADAIKRLCPDGIDIYYDNVGGEQLQVALNAMNTFGRIVACGMISQYNLASKDQMPLKGVISIVAKRLKIQGFIVMDKGMGPKYAADHQTKMIKYIENKDIQVKLSETVGIDNAANGLLGMFKGENFGKAVLKIADLDK